VLTEISEDDSFRLFQEHDLPEKIRTSIEVTGRVNRRRCPLSAPRVAAFVLAMTMNRSLSLPVLLRRFLDPYAERIDMADFREITPEAMIKARARLGLEPLRHLFQTLGAEVEPHETFHGYCLHGIDGVVESMPDTPENDREFGRTKSPRGRSAWPQMRVVPLMELTTRQVVDAVFQPCSAGERSAVPRLLENLGPHDLTLLDRGFSAAWLFQRFLERGTHFVARIGSTWKPRYLERLPDGSWIVEVEGNTHKPGDEERKGAARGPKVTLRLRLVEYSVGRRQRIRLVTDLLDHQEVPALQLAQLYHRRWECELGYDEQKTHLASTAKGTAATILRSKTPTGVYQEAYALLITYNLIRRTIVDAAKLTSADPLQLSFVEVLDRIRVWLPKFQGAFARKVDTLRAAFLRDIARCRIQRPRRKRVYPRVVKRKMSNFGLKRRHHRGQLVDLSAQLCLRVRRLPERKAA
jgi:hypothetical protein